MPKDIFKNLSGVLPGVEKNILLKNYTTYKIGGPARYFFVAKNKEDLIKALKTARQFKLPVFIFAGGSNILVSDKGFPGLAIKNQIAGMELKNENEIRAGAGVPFAEVIKFSAENFLSGLEWASGIPGITAGGAIYGNAQAFGTKTSDAIKEVEALDLKTLRIKIFSKDQCKFSLKNSIFKKNKKFIILSAVFELQKSDSGLIQKRINEFLAHRKNGHPSLPSAGSVFVNPEITIKNKKVSAQFPELNVFLNEKGAIPAGYLIEKSGLRGKKIGKAQISEKHANFIVNLGGAKAKDVLALINLARQKVKKNFRINLETEIQLIGF